jgi:hypothetical protein
MTNARGLNFRRLGVVFAIGHLILVIALFFSLFGADSDKRQIGPPSQGQRTLAEAAWPLLTFPASQLKNRYPTATALGLLPTSLLWGYGLASLVSAMRWGWGPTPAGAGPCRSLAKESSPGTSMQSALSATWSHSGGEIKQAFRGRPHFLLGQAGP